MVCYYGIDSLFIFHAVFFKPFNSEADAQANLAVDLGSKEHHFFLYFFKSSFSCFMQFDGISSLQMVKFLWSVMYYRFHFDSWKQIYICIATSGCSSMDVPFFCFVRI